MYRNFTYGVNELVENMAPKIERFLSVIKGPLQAASRVLEVGRREIARISYRDALLSGLAVFQLKIPSLLQYDLERHRLNLKNLFGIENAPSDTRMREMLDNVEPELLRPCFKALFNDLRQNHYLEQYRVLDGYYALSIDGTEHYCSDSIHCERCLSKTHKDGTVTYTHQTLACSMVKPKLSAVIPFCPEPIVKQDGADKNDCERNAFYRLLKNLVDDHPKLKSILVLDGLFSVAPIIKAITAHSHLRYIIGAKPGDHKYLFSLVTEMGSDFEKTTEDDRGVKYHYSCTRNVSLNKSNLDVKVNFVKVQIEPLKKRPTTFTFVTNLPVTEDTIEEIIAIGRARWKIENETFNTLKTQGYNFEHNYGHGYKDLSTVFAMLMFLAFFIDQAQLLTCTLFQQARVVNPTKKVLWDALKTIFSFVENIPDWNTLLHALSRIAPLKVDFNTS
jgi:Transposase DDE domain